MHAKKLPGVYLVTNPGLVAGAPTPGPLPPAAVGPQRIVTYQRSDGDDATADGSRQRPFRTLAAALRQWPRDAAGNRYIIDRTGCTDELPPGFSLSGYRDSVGARYVTPRHPDPDYPYIGSETAFGIYAEARTLATIAHVDTWTQHPRSQLMSAKVVNAGWTPDQWKGKQLISADHYVQTIRGNSADTLWICNQFELAGPLLITEPNGVLIGGADLEGGTAAVNVSNTGAVISFVGQVLRGITTSWSRAAFGTNGAGPVLFTACELQGNLSLNDSSPVNFMACHLHSLGSSPADGLLQGDRVAVGFGNTLVEGARIQSTFGGAVECDLYQSVWSVADAPLGTDLARLKLLQSEVRGATGRVAAGGIATEVFGNNAVAMGPRSCDVTLFQVLVEGCQGDAISIGFRSGASLKGVGGANNTGVGVRVRSGAQVIVDAVTDVAGATGDLQVGSKQSRRWAHFRQTAPVGNESDFTDAAKSDGSRLSQG